MGRWADGAGVDNRAILNRAGSVYAGLVYAFAYAYAYTDWLN